MSECVCLCLFVLGKCSVIIRLAFVLFVCYLAYYIVYYDFCFYAVILSYCFDKWIGNNCIFFSFCFSNLYLFSTSRLWTFVMRCGYVIMDSIMDDILLIRFEMKFYFKKSMLNLIDLRLNFHASIDMKRKSPDSYCINISPFHFNPIFFSLEPKLGLSFDLPAYCTFPRRIA